MVDYPEPPDHVTNPNEMTNPKQCKTEPARLAFPALFVPKPKFDKGDDLVYSCTILLPPDADLTPFKKAMIAVMEEEWGGARKLAGRANPIKSVDEINKKRADEGKKPWAGYESGWHAVRVQSQYRPEVVDQALQSVFNPAPGATDEEVEKLAKIAEARVYPGSWCRFLLGAYCWSHQGTKGVGFNINAAQLIRDGERLDGRQAASDAFEAVDTGDTEAPESAASGDELDDILG